MKTIWTCRRTYVASLALLILGVLGWRGAPVSEAVSAIAIGVACANAFERSKVPK